jgi:sec-independent protein translocase protein TatA
MRPDPRVAKELTVRLGWMEVLLILAVVLIFFGPKRLPGLGAALGSAIRGFKKGISGIEDASLDTSCPNCKAELPKALAAGERCVRCGFIQPAPQLQSPAPPPRT